MISLAAEISAPRIDYAALSPLFFVLGGACVGVLIEAFIPESRRRLVQMILAYVVLVASFVAIVAMRDKEVQTAADALVIDHVSLFLQAAIVVFGAMGLLLIAHNPARTEVFPLTLFAISGMMLFVMANDLLMMFIALEVLSLPLYLLCALGVKRKLIRQEAALKYFLLGAFASAFFLYGVALIYGYAGAVDLPSIAEAIRAERSTDTLLLVGLGMLAIGLLFKAGVVPFHSWTPDVYQGAPTPITAFMAACTKVAAFGALLRVLYVAFGGVKDDWRPLLIGLAIATMLVGAIMAVTQTDVKRLLAYSAIANAGFILTGLLAMDTDGLSATLFYLVAYGFTTIAAFAVVTLVRDADGEATHLKRWAGLGRRSPLLAATMTFLMLAFAGIPLTSGFTAKFAVFSAALGAGDTAAVIVGVIASMILAFPYLRLVVMMYMHDPGEQGADVHVPSAGVLAAIVIGVVATLLFGVAPEPLLNLAENASQFLSVHG